jgi:DNA-binding SARP family transcriptional activator
MFVDVQFKILGPPELWAAGRETTGASPQLWSLLVCFLMVPNEQVAAEVLIGRLWGEDPPLKAGATIRSYIWRIDQLLSQVPGDAVRLRRRGRGYLLEIDPHAVDVHQVRSLKRQADALAASGEIERAAELLRDAEGLWRGAPLAGLPGDWTGQLRETLEEEHRATLSRRIELDLALGKHATLLAELATLVRQHPLDEELAARQMLALFRSGRQADALRAFREIRARLASDGIDPTPELAQLHQQILCHDPELAITPAYRRAGQEPQPNTLPAATADFTGREDEMQLLAERSGQKRHPAVWIIEGMAGVGKTALAVHAAHRMALRYPDAQLFLSFGAYDHGREPLTPADALRDLLIMLGLPPSRIPGTLRERAALWRAELACRRAVLIFDDVIGPDQIGSLLPDAGESVIMVTSRHRDSGWGTGRSLPLRVLSQRDAAALFTRIAGPGVDAGSAEVGEVAQWCGCLPLAIRLAASRLGSGAVGSLPDLLEELAEPAGGPGSDLMRAMQGAFEVSYQRLSPAERRFFRYLGISPCLEVTAHSGAALSGITLVESNAALSTLASHHLLDETGLRRYTFHDLIRGFAAARFAEEDGTRETRSAIARLADYYRFAVGRANHARAAKKPGMPVSASKDAYELPFTGEPVQAEAWLESEWGNVLRVAEHCARHEFKRRCADLVHGLGEFLETTGHWDDARAAHLLNLQACRDLNDLPGIARSAFDLSLTNLRTGHSELALQYATDAATAFAACGDSTGKAAALDRIGVVHRNAARFRDALAYHQEALEVFREAGDRRGLAQALVHAGAALWYLGRLREEMDYLSQALEIYRQDGDQRGQAITLNNIGTVQHHQGLHRDAMRSYQESHDIFREIGGRQNLAIADHNLARLQQYKGNYTGAIAIYRDVLATYRQLGDLQHEAYALADIGTAYRCDGRVDEAMAHYEKAASAAVRAGDRYAYAEAVYGMAEARSGAGRLEAALENYEQAAKLAWEIESLYLRAKALSGIAEITLHTKGAGAAKICWREALDIFAQIGVPEAAAVEIRLQTLDVHDR